MTQGDPEVHRTNVCHSYLSAICPITGQKSRCAPVQNVTRGIPRNVGTHIVTSLVKIGISSFVSIPGGIVWNYSGKPGIQRQGSW